MHIEPEPDTGPEDGGIIRDFAGGFPEESP